MIDTLRSGWITTGPKAKRFEHDFAEHVGAKHAIAVAHCTGALHLAFWSLGIEQGDEVITTPFTFTASAEVLAYLGPLPVFVDIDPDTFNIDPVRIEALLESGKHTGSGRLNRCILPVSRVTWSVSARLPAVLSSKSSRTPPTPLAPPVRWKDAECQRSAPSPILPVSAFMQQRI